MPNTFHPHRGSRTRIEQRATEMRRAIGTDIRTIREDAGIPQARLAAAADISRAHLSGIEAGISEASSDVLVRLGDALGATISLRAYPGTGPRIRDHLQASILDALLRVVHERWKRFVEVPVYKPARGVIDLVIHEPSTATMVATEIQSELRRLEQLIRWSNQKRDSLPSADVWAFAANLVAPTVSGLLVVRSTRATRTAVNEHAALVATVFPAPAADAYAALTTIAPWPGPALLWAAIGGTVRLLDRPPRGVTVGR